jgi:hypothetical protein
MIHIFNVRLKSCPKMTYFMGAEQVHQILVYFLEKEIHLYLLTPLQIISHLIFFNLKFDHSSY